MLKNFKRALTFSSSRHVEYIWGYFAGFFRQSNNAQWNTISFIKKVCLKLVIVILMSRSNKVAQHYCYSICAILILMGIYPWSYLFYKYFTNILASLITFKSSRKQKTLQNFVAFIKPFFWRPIHPLLR